MRAFSKPWPLVLNRGHPLAKHLVGAWPMQERGGSTTRDSTRKIAGTLAAGVVWHPDRSTQFAEQQYGITSSTPANMGNDNMTMWALVFLPGNSRGCFMHTGSSAWTGYSLGVGNGDFDNTGNNLIGLHDGLGWINTATAIGYGWHSVAYRLLEGTRSLWIDGKVVHDAFGAPGDPSDAAFYIGGHPYSARRGITGRVAMVYVYDRPITAANMRALHRDPYLLYREEPTRHLLVSVVTPGTTTVRLTWTDNSEGEDGFSIERKAGAGAYAVVHTTAAGVETWDDTSLPEGETYTYRVRATSAALGDSEYSNEVEVTV